MTHWHNLHLLVRFLVEALRVPLYAYLFLVYRLRRLRRIGGNPWLIAWRMVLGKPVFGD